MKSLEEILANTELDPVTGCRIWLGCIGPQGYSRIRWQGEDYQVHRLVWKLTTGCSPGALDVLHTCDHRACCEFAHLFLGTQLDNMRDCVAKGRMHRGERNGSHKLTEAQVVKIKELLVEGTRTQEQIANIYGVCQPTISWIARNAHWKHVPWVAKKEQK